jgi:hypothetical protein
MSVSIHQVCLEVSWLWVEEVLVGEVVGTDTGTETRITVPGTAPLLTGSGLDPSDMRTITAVTTAQPRLALAIT